MNPGRWARVKSLFAGALEVDAVRREAWIDERCGDDASLADEVRGMLAHATTVDAPADLLQERRRGAHEVLPRSGRMRVSPEILAAARGLCAGRVLVSRYALTRRLAVGAFGSVYAADDRLTGRAVAVKALFPDDAASLEALRREVATLRRARLPGVVELLDDWTEGGAAFIVMELISGAPFPGCDLPAAWERVARTAIALLEAVDRLHWLGVLHRDLKPENILVDAGGRPTVVDLGVAVESSTPRDAGQFAYVVGTPGYLSPERLRGEHATKSSDLYAIGVMLWETLAGCALQPATTLAELVRVRCRETPPPLRSFAPDVPAHVAAVIDAMIAPDPAERPVSAGVVARALRGECGVHEEARRALPRLGGDEPVRTVVADVCDGRSLDVVGPPRSGRTRVLEDAAAELVRRGVEVLWIRPRSGALRALEAAIGMPPAQLTSEGALAWAVERLAHAIDRGAALLADDADRMDTLSREALATARSRGRVVRALAGAPDGDVAGSVVLRPLSNADLEPLFAVPSRFSHDREDAVAALASRSRGLPGAVAETLERWVEDGLARREDDRFEIGRPALDRIRAESRFAPPPRMESVPALGPAERRIAGFLEVASVPIDTSAVARLAGCATWEAEAALRELERAGCVVVEPSAAGAHVRMTAAPGVAATWTPEERRAAHTAIAGVLPAETEARVFHLIAGDVVNVASREAVGLAGAMLGEGRVGAARSLIVDALAALRATADGDACGDECSVRDARVALLRVLLFCALSAASPSELEIVLYHLHAARGCGSAVAEIERVARAALLAVRGDSERALLMSHGAASHHEVERSRHAVRAFAAQTRSESEHQALILEANRWARRSQHAEDRARAAEWLGWLRYRQQRFGVAHCLQSRAARRWGASHAAFRAALNAATAAIEAGLYGEAEDLVRTASEHIARRRDTYGEIWCAWLERSVAYRRGDAVAADRSLARAAMDVPNSRHAGLLAMNEAAIAWRRGDLGAGRELATCAAAYSRSVGDDAAALLCSCLARACGVPGDGPSDDGLVVQLRDSDLPRVALQCAALLAQTGDGPGDELRRIGLRHAEGVRRNGRDFVAEVLSPREALDALARPRVAG